VPGYVLGKPSAEDKAAIDEAIARSIDVLPLILAGDMQSAMQKLHTDPAKARPEPKPRPEPTTETKAEPVAKAAPKAEAKPAPKAEPEPKPKPEPATESNEGGLKGLFGLLKPKRGK
jgi:hypothetical protein